MEKNKEDPEELGNIHRTQSEEIIRQEKEESPGPSKRKMSRSIDEEYERGRKRMRRHVEDRVGDSGLKRLRSTEDGEERDFKKVKLSSSRKLSLQGDRKSDGKDQQRRGQKRSREPDDDREPERQKLAKTSSSGKSPPQEGQKIAQTPSPRQPAQKRSRETEEDEREEEQDRVKKVKISFSGSHHERESDINHDAEQEAPRCGSIASPKESGQKRSRECDEEEEQEQHSQKKVKISSEKQSEDNIKKDEPSTDHNAAGGSEQIRNITTFVTSSLTDYTFQKTLGQGSFGTVKLALHRSSSQLVAIKIIRTASLPSRIIQAERRILQKAQGSPFLCHGLTSFHTPDDVFLVMEFVPGGSLDSFMAQKGALRIDESRFIAAELICGIQFLHSRGIIHRDLKPENILLDHEGHVKIADFGLAAENVSVYNQAKGMCGTLPYTAPEVLCDEEYDVSADWWSFGVILFFMVTGKLPYTEKSSLTVYRRQVFNKHPQYPDWLDGDARNIISRLLDKNPDTRLGVTGRITEHPFFSGIDWEEVGSGKARPPFQMAACPI